MQRQPYTTLSDATRMSVAPGLPGTRPWVGWLRFLIVACALLGTAWQRFAGEPLNDEAGPVQWQRTLNFADRPNGDIAVFDATSGLQVAQFQGEQGFVRGALRSLARERRRSGLGPEQPFELMGHTNGRITLRDPATGMRLNLESFGPTNAANFSRLQSASPATPAIFESPSTQGKS
jgi:putative photosynthetic complex assembly protein